MSDKKTSRIVIGITDGEIDRAEESRIITLAAAVLAAMAALGNGDDLIANQALLLASDAFVRMGEDAKGTLKAISEEMIDCARTGKKFIAFARFKGS